MKEVYFDSEGVPFVEIDGGNVYRMDGDKRVLMSPKSGTYIVFNSSTISKQRALDLASERGEVA